MKKEYADIKNAILNLDDSLFSLDELISLKSFIPTPEEINLVSEYKGDFKLLDKPEQFFLEVKKKHAEKKKYTHISLTLFFELH